MGLFSSLSGKAPQQTSKYEQLRPIVRSVLMKDVITESDIDVIKKKASGLGLDPDEVGIQVSSLDSVKKKAASKTSLIGRALYSDYFNEGGQFDEDFDKVFLTEQEQKQKSREDEGLINSVMGGIFGR